MFNTNQSIITVTRTCITFGCLLNSTVTIADSVGQDQIAGQGTEFYSLWLPLGVIDNLCIKNPWQLSNMGLSDWIGWIVLCFTTISLLQITKEIQQQSISKVPL